MAIQLTKELDSGVEASYHRITGLSLDMPNQAAQIQVSGYKDAAARQTGKQPIARRTLRVFGEGYPFTVEAMTAANVIALAYRYIKMQDEYAAGTDC